MEIAEVKDFLRVEHAQEDVLLGGLVRTAAGLCEAFTGRVLIARAVREIVPATGAWQRLTTTPVRAFGAVETLDGLAVPASDYETDIDASGDGWVRVGRVGEPVRVTCTGGMAEDWSGVPEPLRHGVLRLVAHLHAHRDAAGDPGPPAAVTALWRPWRRMRLA